MDALRNSLLAGTILLLVSTIPSKAAAGVSVNLISDSAQQVTKADSASTETTDYRQSRGE